MREKSLHFIPSKVEGLVNVDEVIILPTCLKLLSDEQWHVFDFSQMAEWPRPEWLWRILARFGYYSSLPMVGERDWFHSPEQRFIRFYTEPQITVFMPVDEPEEYGESYFWRAQLVMLKGRFQTQDLG